MQAEGGSEGLALFQGPHFANTRLRGLFFSVYRSGGLEFVGPKDYSMQNFASGLATADKRSAGPRCIAFASCIIGYGDVIGPVDHAISLAA